MFLGTVMSVNRLRISSCPILCPGLAFEKENKGKKSEEVEVEVHSTSTAMLRFWTFRKDADTLYV
jgi:hypothetical protein